MRRSSLPLFPCRLARTEEAKIREESGISSPNAADIAARLRRAQARFEVVAPLVLLFSSVIFSLFLRPTNYPEQCGVIKRNAFRMLQISRLRTWRITLAKNSQHPESWVPSFSLSLSLFRGTIRKKMEWGKKKNTFRRRTIRNYVPA